MINQSKTKPYHLSNSLFPVYKSFQSRLVRRICCLVRSLTVTKQYRVFKTLRKRAFENIMRRDKMQASLFYFLTRIFVTNPIILAMWNLSSANNSNLDRSKVLICYNNNLKEKPIFSNLYPWSAE